MRVKKSMPVAAGRRFFISFFSKISGGRPNYIFRRPIIELKGWNDDKKSQGVHPLPFSLTLQLYPIKS